MKFKEIKDLSKVDLDNRLVELKKDLMKIKAEVSVSNPKNPGRISVIKKTIARILTVSKDMKESKSPTKLEKQKEGDKKA